MMSMEFHRGVTRGVFLVGRWAIKVPVIRRHGGGHQGLAGVMYGLAGGIQANLSEKIWSRTDGVCPVLFSAAGLLNVYPRCAPVRDFAEDYDSVAPDLPVTDQKPCNLGILHGRVVWVDYALS